MKKYLNLIFLFILITSCNKNDDNNDCQGINCLPQATQTGEGTFGCLVNGEPFVDNSGFFNCFYQLVDGEYFFNISPNFEGKKLIELDLGSNNVNFSIESQFTISDYSDGKGAAIFSISQEFRDISTNTAYNGLCQITNFDLQNNVISGTFEFEVFDEVTQTLYKITEGRFDSQFTQ